MKVYVGHSRDFDFVNELYKPLRNSEIGETIELVFPHENPGVVFNSKEDLKTIDVMIAELSFPSTGLGIEIGYADIYKVPIIIIVKSGITISSSARALATHIIEYSTISELVQNLKLVLKQIVTEKNTA